jgi:molybdate transport system substrate-binding protein
VRLRFISAGAAQGVVHGVARQQGVEVEGTFGAVGAMLERLQAGEGCDVVILTKAQIAKLASERLVDAASVVDLGAVATSIAVREGRVPPDVSTGAALRAALLASNAIFFPDPSKATAGIHFAKVVEQLGIADAVASRYRLFPNGMTAMASLAHAPGDSIGCTQATEILATPGVRLVGPLPPGHELRTVYTAAVNTRAASQDEAARFVALLGGEAQRPARRAAGFE